MDLARQCGDIFLRCVDFFEVVVLSGGGSGDGSDDNAVMVLL